MIAFAITQISKSNLAIQIVIWSLCIQIAPLKYQNSYIQAHVKIGISNRLLFLACDCNSQGSTKDDGSTCFGKCCNDNGSCRCKLGYIGSDCNQCDAGYYETNIINEEKTCSGEQTWIVL